MVAAKPAPISPNVRLGRLMIILSAAKNTTLDPSLVISFASCESYIHSTNKWESLKLTPRTDVQPASVNPNGANLALYPSHADKRHATELGNSIMC